MNAEYPNDAKLQRLVNTTYKENTDAFLSRSDLSLDEVKRYVRTRVTFEGWARKRAAHAMSMVTQLQGKLANLKRELQVHRRKLSRHRRDKAAELAKAVIDGRPATEIRSLAEAILAETTKAS